MLDAEQTIDGPCQLTGRSQNRTHPPSIGITFFYNIDLQNPFDYNIELEIFSFYASVRDDPTHAIQEEGNTVQQSFKSTP
jgi:hypothetical protein